MTATSTVNGSTGAAALISSELVDRLVESVGLPHDPLVRAEVISNLLAQLYTAVEWLHGPEQALDDAAGRELTSLRQLVAAGHDHQRRMQTPNAARAAAGGRT